MTQAPWRSLEDVNRYNGQMLAHALAVPFRFTALCVILLYTLVGRFCQFVGDPAAFPASALQMAFVLPLWYIVLTVLPLYARRWFVHISRGLVAEPLEGETDVSPFMTAFPLHLAALLFGTMMVWWLNGPEPTAWLIGAAIAITYLWLGVALEESVLRGLHPIIIWRITVGASYVFPLVVLFVGGGILTLTYVLIHSKSILLLGASAIVFLATQGIAAWLLFKRRSELGLLTFWSPEQANAEVALAEARERDVLLQDLDVICSRGEFGLAYKKLESYLEDDFETLDPLMHERLTSFGYDELYLEHAVHYLHRLYEANERRKAWAVLKESLQRDDAFRPMDGGVLLDLTRSAGKDDAGWVDLLLGDFERAYPESPLLPDALFRHARVEIELLNAPHRGVATLQRIVDSFPAFIQIDDVRAYLARVRPR